MAKYLKKYANELKDGMRRDGKSMVECCLIWGITLKEYEEMLDNNEELVRANEIGDMHCASWWHLKYRDLAEKGNASALTFGMKNIPKVSWQDKPADKAEEIEPVRAINITVLPPRAGEEDNTPERG